MPSWISKLTSAVFAASVGATAGYFYGRASLPPDLQPRLIGMYAAGGGAIGVLAMRFLQLLISVVRNYRGGSGPQGDE